MVRPLSFCYCSCADLVLPLLKPVWFGEGSPTLGQGWRDRRPVPGTHLRFVSSHSHRCPSLCCLLARRVLFSPSWAAHLFCLGFSPFVMFWSLLPVTSFSSQPNPASHLHAVQKQLFAASCRREMKCAGRQQCALTAFPSLAGPWTGQSFATCRKMKVVSGN